MTVAEEIQWQQVSQELRAALTAYAREPQFAQAMASGLLRFWEGRYTTETAGGMDDNERWRFFDWFTFDAALDETGVRLIDRYLAERGHTLNERERRLLVRWQQAPPASVYRVTAVEQEASILTLEDLFAHLPPVRVQHRLAAAWVQPDELLLTRPLPGPKGIWLSGLIIRLKVNNGPDLRATMNAAWAEYQATYHKATWIEFLRARTEMLDHMVIRLVEASARSVIALTYS